ncbi:MAG: sulfur-carrier protein [Actinomycetota bacterium]|nr:sulfur-carrier protein [Actinomycetota bacterium]
MAIEIRIPTILRTYTGGEKAVTGDGATLADVLVDLDARHPGLRDRIVDEKGLRRFVNVYVNDEDVRFMGGLETGLKDGDTVTVLPAVAGGAGEGRAGGASVYVAAGGAGEGRAGGASVYVAAGGAGEG